MQNGSAQQPSPVKFTGTMNPAAPTVRWLNIFNTLAAGSLITLLSSCASLKAPKTLFITLGIEEKDFKTDTAQIRSFLDKYTETFQRSNPDVNVVYINYKSKNFYDQVAKDTSLNLGPDLVITEQASARELFARGLITTLPNQQYFDAIYSPRTQSVAKTKAGYLFAPWLITTQLACFNKTKVKNPPSTIEELEELSASGIRIGLVSNVKDLIWTAGTQGAIPELSSLGSAMTTHQAYPGIQAWLQWLQRAALYQNISFHESSRELSLKLKNHDLDWTTCWGGIALEDLKKTMGNNLGVTALPNGSSSKALPVHTHYGFSLGKNSSPSQRAMALKFIRTNVNTVAQRKLQLDDLGFLAANQNVSIPPESSKSLTAVNTSYNEQASDYTKEWPGIVSWLFPEARDSKKYGKRFLQINNTFRDLTNGYLTVEEAFKTTITNPTN